MTQPSIIYKYVVILLCVAIKFKIMNITEIMGCNKS